MRGLKTDRTATGDIDGHAFIQNLRRPNYQLGIEATAEQASLRRRIRRTHLKDLTRSTSDRATSTRYPNQQRSNAGASIVRWMDLTS